MLIVGFGPRARPLSLARRARAERRARARVADYPPSALGAHAADRRRQPQAGPDLTLTLALAPTLPLALALPLTLTLALPLALTGLHLARTTPL